MAVGARQYAAGMPHARSPSLLDEMGPEEMDLPQFVAELEAEVILPPTCPTLTIDAAGATQRSLRRVDPAGASPNQLRSQWRRCVLLAVALSRRCSALQHAQLISSSNKACISSSRPMTDGTSNCVVCMSYSSTLAVVNSVVLMHCP